MTTKQHIPIIQEAAPARTSVNAGGWCVYSYMTDALHVLPRGDIRDHYLQPSCPCHPMEEDGVIVHNSFDGREAFETGERSLS